MAFGKRIDQSFLGESAIRLARLLGLGGLISPQFDSGEKLTPVILVGDATGIGYRGSALRQWAYAETVPAAAGFNSKLAIKAVPNSPGIIIDGLILSSTGVLTWRLGLLSSTGADPWVIGQTNSLPTERYETDPERVNVLTAPQNSDALTYGLAIGIGLIPGNQSQPVIPIPIMLSGTENGGKLIVQSTTANQPINVTVWGRLL